MDSIAASPGLPRRPEAYLSRCGVPCPALWQRQQVAPGNPLNRPHELPLTVQINAAAIGGERQDSPDGSPPLLPRQSLIAEDFLAELAELLVGHIDTNTFSAHRASP